MQIIMRQPGDEKVTGLHVAEDGVAAGVVPVGIFEVFKPGDGGFAFR